VESEVSSTSVQYFAVLSKWKLNHGNKCTWCADHIVLEVWVSLWGSIWSLISKLQLGKVRWETVLKDTYSLEL